MGLKTKQEMKKVTLKKSSNDFILAINEQGEIKVYEDMPTAIIDIVLDSYYQDINGEYQLTFELKKL